MLLRSEVTKMRRIRGWRVMNLWYVSFLSDIEVVYHDGIKSEHVGLQ